MLKVSGSRWSNNSASNQSSSYAAQTPATDHKERFTLNLRLLSKMENLEDSLFLAGYEVSDDELVFAILMGLPAGYDKL